MKTALLFGICGGLLLMGTACGDDDSNGAIVPGVPGDPPIVTLTGVPSTVAVGDLVDLSASVSAPSGLRTNDTFEVLLSGPVSVSDTFDAAEVPGCSGGDTFCSVTLSELAGPIIFNEDETGTYTFTLTAFDGFNAAGSQSATFVVQ